MKNFCLYLVVFIVMGVKLQAQDFVSDSLRSAYANAGSDSAKTSALILLSRHQWFDVRKPDTAIAVMNNALVHARQKSLADHEVQAMKWLGLYYTTATGKNLDPAKGTGLTRQALSLARTRQLRAREIELLLNLSGMLGKKTDSAKQLMTQALNLSQQNKLAEQEILSMSRWAAFYRLTMPDSSRYFLIKALSVANQSNLPERQTGLLQNIASLYSLNHWGDSSRLLMQEAVRIARDNRLVEREINLLTFLISSETGFFLRDSMAAYYERVQQLSRQFHRDSLGFMARYSQSSTDIGAFPKALEISFILLRENQARKDSAAIQNALYAIGLIYESTKDYKKAIGYLYEAKKYYKANNFIYLFINIDLAKSYLALKQNDSARYYSAQAYQLSETFYGSAANIYGGVLNDLGTVYFELGEDSLALDYLRRSYIFFTKRSIEYLNYSHTVMGLAKCFKKAGMADSSFFYAKLCLGTARDKGFLPYLTESSQLIAEYFKNRGNTDSAYFYQQIGFNAYQTLYNDESSREFQNLSFAEQQREKDVAQAEKAAADQYRSSLRLYALLTVIAVAILIGFIVVRNNRHKQRSYDLLTKQKQETDLQKSKLESSLKELQATQSQLIQSEKMASLGELTAGIAHEIQNPLNFVNNFSEVNTELIKEMRQEIDKGNLAEVKNISGDIEINEQKINHHGKRADAIVKGMLQHSRSSNGLKEPADINALADEYLRLAYHGLRAKDKSFNANMVTDFDPSIGKINIIPQDMGRVILNLITNAFYAVTEKKKQANTGYEPTVTVSTKHVPLPGGAQGVEVRVSDNGNGIPQKVLDKIFQPFFTTKPAGQGTGLGLSLSYDIVKVHGGELTVETKEAEGSSFIIRLP
jgi:two-component system NtrC family sensor kinase